MWHLYLFWVVFISFISLLSLLYLFRKQISLRIYGMKQSYGYMTFLWSANGGIMHPKLIKSSVPCTVRTEHSLIHMDDWTGDNHYKLDQNAVLIYQDTIKWFHKHNRYGLNSTSTSTVTD
eukprot:496226_1